MTLVGADDLQRRLAAIRSEAGDRAMMQALGRAVAAQAIKSAPRRTGTLQRSIKVENPTNDSVTIEVGAAYGIVVERGSKPHIIRPRNAKALRFATGAGRDAGITRLTGSIRRMSQSKHRAAVGGGLIAFARFVRHPGTQAQPFLVPAAQDVIKRSGIVINDIVTRWNRAA